MIFMELTPVKLMIQYILFEIAQISYVGLPL